LYSDSADLISSDMLRKSSHGGKRVGAGRPRSYDSVRDQLEQANEHADEWGGYTRYEIERDSYLLKHAHVLLIWLSSMPDKTVHGWQNSGQRWKPLMSRARAYKIAHLPKGAINENRRIGTLSGPGSQTCFKAVHITKPQVAWPWCRKVSVLALHAVLAHRRGAHAPIPVLPCRLNN
jgi:hypothetical protein